MVYLRTLVLRYVCFYNLVYNFWIFVKVSAVADQESGVIGLCSGQACVCLDVNHCDGVALDFCQDISGVSAVGVDAQHVEPAAFLYVVVLDIVDQLREFLVGLGEVVFQGSDILLYEGVESLSVKFRGGGSSGFSVSVMFRVGAALRRSRRVFLVSDGACKDLAVEGDVGNAVLV